MASHTAPESSRPLVVTSKRAGSSAHWSRTLIPTAREAPNDAETPSHILLHRAGFVRQVGAGIYDYLPLGWRVINKIADIVREEMNDAGASELLMPALEPLELFAGTKRDVDYGDNLFRLKDRRGREAALAPTHEEVITELMLACVTSYKQLPLNLYQIQTKFRDEARPRAGLLRCREFLMKDAYSFHAAIEGPGGLNEAYDAMYRAYTNIFTRCGLDFSAVEADSGPIGGSASHEFMVNCVSGEDTILKCPVSGYAANVEKCEIGHRPGSFEHPAVGDWTEVHTPNLPGIDEVGKFMKVKPERMLKSIVFEAGEVTADALANPSAYPWLTIENGAKTAGPKWIVVVVRGDHDANEGKAKIASGCMVKLADEKAARAAGFAIGYVSPRVVNSVPGTLLLVDPDVAQGGFWATGSDKADHHAKYFNWKREIGATLDDARKVKITDVRNAMAGDPSPRAAGTSLVTGRGIEVGHIFKLGTKYSVAMGLSVLDQQQQKRAVIMGCYGIGVSRTMAACVEMSHDANGIVWPKALAPYHVLITIMRPDDAAQVALAGKIACALVGEGVDVLVDDRDERPGVKFKDADLIGLPIRLTLGEKAMEQGCVEFKARRDEGKGELVAIDAVVAKCVEMLNA